ncbi:hypothetical protein PUNSTDRAFT_47207 [Punctularia strigosozonata HHB-11173 SS5]|uniref:Uncharacterized protein n=1 Tax=Punctularia strigosozonata (strain HHB-11173) TaxID=741275 RepID=R7S4Z6_PUNST|nr:uncharacterized protein PUNSTDRAFT_47207 [Punctularia strigosozonata HHB-11173 SS5]EIN04964.1 hypothetical protein PUNSTDRAFT_47207 [Punctularia strigosozonata HHB-11173 SS5]
MALCNSRAVLPIGRLDAANPTNNIISNNGWLVDVPLDVLKLKMAWTQLNQAWPILSYRLKKNGRTGDLEFHMIEQSAIVLGSGFTTATVAGPVASRFDYPKPTDSISCVPLDIPHHFFSHPSRCSANALLNKDVPVAALHVTRFDDATIVGLSVSHALVDGSGTKAIVLALLGILKGEEVLPLATHDAFETYPCAEDVPPPTGFRVFSLWQMLTLVLVTIWDWLRSPRGGLRVVYIPAKDVARIKAQAMADIAAKESEKSGEWISTSDSIVAFLLKCMFASETRHRPVGVAYLVNIRKHFSSIIPPTYIRNANAGVSIAMPDAAAIPTTSLGTLSLLVRRTLQTQTQQAALVHYIQWRIAKPKQMPMFMEPTGAWAAFTNWREMDFMKIDWTPAALDPGSKRATCLYLHSFGYGPLNLRNAFVIGPDDPSGGIWALGALSDSVWKDVNGFGRYQRK